MKQAVLPPQAIPVDFENIERPDIRESAPVRQKKNRFRAFYYGLILGITTPFAIVGGVEVAKEIERTSITSKSTDTPRFPILAKILGQTPPEDASDFSEETKDIVSNIPKDVRVTIHKDPDITEAKWSDFGLSCTYKGKEARITFLQKADTMIFSRLTIERTDIQLSQAIDLAFLPRILCNASHVIDHLHAKHWRTATALHSDDGARFEFAIRTNGQEKKYVGTTSGLYRRIPSSSPSHSNHLLMDDATNTAITESSAHGETRWYYSKNGVSVVDLFKDHALLYREEFPSGGAKRTDFHAGTTVPHIITQWTTQRNPDGTSRYVLGKENHYLPNGTPYREHSAASKIDKHYDESGLLLVTERYKDVQKTINGLQYTTRESIASTLSHNGKLFSMYPKEKISNPNLTPGQYVQKLATVLDSHQKLHIFTGQYRFWEYVHDSPDPRRPLLKGTELRHGNYIQAPEETVQRVENEKMLGDCDDLSGLMFNVTRSQGKKSQCIRDEKHVFCGWIEKCKNGRYNGISVDFDGLRINGKPYVLAEDKGQGVYDSPEEAFEATLTAYPKALRYHRLPHVTTIQYPANTEHTVHIRALVSQRNTPVQLARK